MKTLLLSLLLTFSLTGFSKEKVIELTSKNTISFNQAFTNSYVAKKQIEAITLCAKSPKSTINIVLYTPGGSISAGQRFFDTLKALPCNFDTITIFSASMGYQTVQQLGNRYILPSGTLMSHRASVRGLSGEVGGELDSIINLIKTNVTELEKVASKRAGITLEQYQNQIRDELWLTGSQAVETKHADEVVLVKCGKSLRGTKVQRVATIFGAFMVEFSKCPIITGPLKISALRRGSNPNKLRDFYTNIKDYVRFEL